MTQNAEGTSAPQFSTPDPALAVGSIHAGFEVVAQEPLPEESGMAYVMRHVASGARLMWLAVDDANRSFAIAFKTPPANDTGVFHILEHSVLCGSERFPVKEPFVNLLKSSMQTFLNAITYPDKTVYPVSSTNVTDLENLMDVYLDAVLHPAIYERPRIFAQEGWHYEYDEESDQLSYNGVVFNEMKGALSDPEEFLLMHANRALYPDTAYGFESGGNPRTIPTLTYEDFIDTHRRHYNLANSYTILYGDLDIERELAFVAQRFENATTREGEPNPLKLQKPVSRNLHRVQMATAPENASVMLSYVLGTATERERVLATDILLDAIAGSNEAPLKRAILDAGLGDDFNVYLLDSMLQPQVSFVLHGAEPDAAASFQQLVEQTCQQIACEGVSPERLSAALSQVEFTLREHETSGSTSNGIMLSLRALKSWLYDDEHPTDYLRYEDDLKHLRDQIGQGYFERLLRELVCESTHHVAVELVPAEEGDAAEEQAELASKRAAMSSDELATIVAEVTALREEQERPDAPEDLAKLPRLSVSDIGDAPRETPARLVEAPLPCLAHELDTHHIIHACYYFDLRRLDYDELSYAGLLTDLLGSLDTERLSASELDTVCQENLGTLSFAAEVYGRDEDLDFARPLLVVRASALSEKVAQLASLPAEIWSTTRFDDLERLHDIVQQRRVQLEQAFLGSGHASATGRLNSYFTATYRTSTALNGINYYLFLKDLLAHWDERAPELPRRLKELSRRIFTADEVLVSLACSSAERKRFWQEAKDLGLSQAGPEICAHRLQVPEARVCNEAFVIPSNVCYVAEGMPPIPQGVGDHGTWGVASRALSYDYLWNEVRVKGGAYGCGFRHNTNGLAQFWSYRDPAVDPTSARFEGAGDWLSHWDPSEEDFEGFIVATVAALDAPLGARMLARRQDGLFLSERPEGWRDLIRAQHLAATPEKVRAVAPSLTKLADQSAFCVFGGREQIEASDIDLTVVDLMG